MSTQSNRSAQTKIQAPNQPSTHTYRLFKLLKNDVAEQREPRIIQIEKCGSRLLKIKFRNDNPVKEFPIQEREIRANFRLPT